MSVIITDINDTSFSLNGVLYIKNFMSVVRGESVHVLNVYDTRFVLDQGHYSEFTVGGTSYNNAEDLATALSSILFAKNSSGGGAGAETDPIFTVWRDSNPIHVVKQGERRIFKGSGNNDIDNLEIGDLVTQFWSATEFWFLAKYLGGVLTEEGSYQKIYTETI